MPPSSRPIFEPGVILLERERELASLRAALEHAADGTPSVTVIAGEAGIGKSRLIRELVTTPRCDDVFALRGDCVEFEGMEMPYGPLSTALRDVPQTVMAEVWHTLPPSARQAIYGAFPHAGIGEEPTEEVTLTSFSQSRLYESLFTMIRALSQHGVVLFTIEDFHWVDRSSRDFIVFLARNLHRERVALVVTYRSDELPPEHAVRRLLGELRRLPIVTYLELERLSRAAIAQMLAHAMGEAPPRELVDGVYGHSGGNPFFAEELLKARIATGTSELPLSLRDVLLLRYRELSLDAQRALRFAAASGTSFDPAFLAVAFGVPEPKLSASLREAREHHLIVDAAPPRAEPVAATKLAFRHDAVREAIYGELLAPERTALHAALASALESTGARAELAFHLRAAGLSGALASSIEAGFEAERTQAFGDALYQYEEALRLWDALNGPSEDVPRDRADVLGRAGDLAKYVGESKRACRYYNAALAILDHEREPVRTASLFERRGRCESYNDDAGLASFEAAFRLIPDDRRADRAQLMSEVGFALTLQMRYDEALERCTSALELALQADAASVEGYARMRLGVALSYLGNLTQGEQQLRKARALALESGNAEEILRAYLYLGEVLRLSGRIEDALSVTTEGAEKARQLGMWSAFGRYLTLNAAADLFFLGRWEETSARLAPMAGVHLEAWEALLYEQIAGELQLARGRLDAAATHLARARELFDRGAPPEFAADVYAPLAELALRHGDVATARDCVAIGIAALRGRPDALHAPFLFATAARVEAVAAERLRPRPSREAKRFQDELDRVLERCVRGTCPPIARAFQATCHAEVARAAGEPSAALWVAAREGWNALGAPYPATHATWRQAEAVLLEGGGRNRVASALREAHVAATRLGALGLVADIEGCAHEHRLNLKEPATAGGSPPAGVLGLTARETDVLKLLAGGLTNRQIAQRLVISEKTVSVHMTHIFAKLDVHTRAAATAVAHRAEIL